MEYRAVGQRLAVDIDSLHLPMGREEILSILVAKKFKILKVDVVALARKCLGAQYQLGAGLNQAPEAFDCSSLVKWLYGQCGIWLPRRSIQQREFGEKVELRDVISGDIVFVSGCRDWYLEDPADGIGHVGLATGEDSVVHAANKKNGVIESSLAKFTKKGFRGIRRYIPKGHNVVFLETPAGKEIETSDDIRWIVLQSMK